MVSDQQTLDSLLDIHKLFVVPFVQVNMAFAALDFTTIPGYPNQALKFRDLREFPVFSGSNAITVA